MSIGDTLRTIEGDVRDFVKAHPEVQAATRALEEAVLKAANIGVDLAIKSALPGLFSGLATTAVDGVFATVEAKLFGPDAAATQPAAPADVPVPLPLPASPRLAHDPGQPVASAPVVSAPPASGGGRMLTVRE